MTTFTLRVQQAVMDSSLPKELRHLVHVLAVLASSETGCGFHSQTTIAKAMGCSDRHVRTLLAELERPDAAPVRLERRKRYRGPGRGRTSDSWQLVVVDGEAAPADLSAATNRNTVPVEEPTNRNTVPPEHGSAGTPRRTYRNATTDLPEQRSGDLRTDLRSDLRTAAAARNTVPAEQHSGWSLTWESAAEVWERFAGCAPAPSWRSDFGNIAVAVNAQPEPRRALEQLMRWFWLDAGGPIASGRIPRDRAAPAALARSVERDLEHAQGRAGRSLASPRPRPTVDLAEFEERWRRALETKRQAPTNRARELAGQQLAELEREMAEQPASLALLQRLEQAELEPPPDFLRNAAS